MLKKIAVAPQTTRRGRFRIRLCLLQKFLVAGIMLLPWVHQLAIRLLIPPGVTEIWIHEQVALVHVAVHALTGRNRARKLMDDWMAAFVFGYGRVASEA